MRHFIGAAGRFLLLALLVASLPSNLFARGPNSFAREAELEYLDGDYESAKAKFEILLKEPRMNAMAKYYLERIAMAEAAPGAREMAQLRKLNLPVVELREASLDSALEYLCQQVIKASNGELKPNFVVQSGVNRSVVMTLSLKNVSFREALRYLGPLATVRVVIAPKEILVRPLSNDQVPLPPGVDIRLLEPISNSESP